MAVTSFKEWLSSLFGSQAEPIGGYTEDERKEVAAQVDSYFSEGPDKWSPLPRELPSGAGLLDAPPRIAILVIESMLALEAAAHGTQNDARSEMRREQRARMLVAEICKQPLPFTSDNVPALLQQLIRLQHHRSSMVHPALVLMMLRMAKAGGWLAGLHAQLEKLRDVLAKAIGIEHAAVRKYKKELAKFIDEAAGQPLPRFSIARDAWGELALADLEVMDAGTRQQWSDILAYAATAKGTAPSAKWLKTATAMLDAHGKEFFAAQTLRWLALLRIPNPRREAGLSELKRLMIADDNGDILKGLAWLLVQVPTEQTASALRDAAEQAFRKIPNWGSRSTKFGNACVQALKLFPALIGARELAILGSEIKKPSHASTIATALRERAVRAGTTVEEIEELATPDHGFSAGTLDYTWGDFTARLTVDGTSISVQWSGPDGKPRKAEPASIKREFATELKAMKRVQKDAEKALAAARDRLEKLLLNGREWPVDRWRERYAEHPLIGGLAKRLIWRFTKEGADFAAIHVDGRWIDEAGNAVDIEASIVSPWHPVSALPDTVRRWRVLLLAHGITQPFKQAHREIYLLTDAERQTQTYSNRFAAHVLRQHQFASLCMARGWRYSLQGAFDSHNTPTIVLPKWNLHAQFWVEGISNDEEGLSPSGIALLVTTDQVRFCSVGPGDGGATGRGPSQPMPLEQVPPIVFSEVMRDVDLFVGVTSVGADPTWNEGGPHGRHYGYWTSYSFGDLSPMAQTRRELIGDLLPRLELRDVATIEGKFLVVRGRLRTYKIHLGSGNILMDPNDQYLCIVPDRSSRDLGVNLPFEGDTTLSIVLSKAFLLAKDDQIKDPSIRNQIRGA